MKSMEEEKSKREENEDLTEEELQEFMAAYKEELSRLYKMNRAKKQYIARKTASGSSAQLLEQCDKELREDIDALKRKYGIHY